MLKTTMFVLKIEHTTTAISGDHNTNRVIAILKLRMNFLKEVNFLIETAISKSGFFYWMHVRQAFL